MNADAKQTQNSALLLYHNLRTMSRRIFEVFIHFDACLLSIPIIFPENNKRFIKYSIKLKKTKKHMDFCVKIVYNNQEEILPRKLNTKQTKGDH